jgi:hypothetical protein
VVAGLPDAKTSIRIDFPDCGVVGEEVEEEETIAVLAVVAAVVLAEELGMLPAVVVAIVVVEVVLKVVVEVSMVLVSGRRLSSGTTSTCRTKSGGGGSGVDGDGGEVVKFSIGVDDDPQIEGFTSVVTISSSSFGTPGTVTDVLITSSTTCSLSSGSGSMTVTSSKVTLSADEVSC